MNLDIIEDFLVAEGHKFLRLVSPWCFVNLFISYENIGWQPENISPPTRH